MLTTCEAFKLSEATGQLGDVCVNKCKEDPDKRGSCSTIRGNRRQFSGNAVSPRILSGLHPDLFARLGE